MELHVGRGVTRGGMTVFPLWGGAAGFSGCTTDPKHLDVSECDDGPDVSTVMVGNTGERPVLVLEGQLFEGGWQHRMASGSTLVGVRQRVPVEVACVEQGRWGGSHRQQSRGRRATPFVRESVRGAADMQGEVWRRVAMHTRGTDNVTGSLVRHLDASQAAPDLDAFTILPGQAGVLIGVGGQPYVAEVFDSRSTLRRQFRSIIEGVALDACMAPRVETPGRRARRFIERFDHVRLGAAGSAGIAEHLVGRSEYVDASAVRWQDRDLHLRMSNVRHPLLVGGGSL